MKLFAAITSENIVTRVVVAGDDDAQPGCKLDNGEVAWVETNKDGSIRANFPHVGSEYRPAEDVFCGKKYFPSWILDTTTWTYKSPTPEPPEPRMVEINSVSTELTSSYWEEDNQRWIGTIASPIEGKEETHLNKYIFDHVNTIWVFDSTIEKPSG